MKTQNKFLSWFANPKWYFLLPIIIIAIGSAVGSMIILTQAELYDYIVWGYILLGITVATLSYSVFGVIRIYPKTKASILKWSEKHPRINKLFNQYGFTTLIATTCALIISLAYAVYNGTVAVLISSIWFGALAAYNIVLTALRGSVLIYHGKRSKAVDKGQSETQTLINDGKLHRACGILLLLLPVCLSFAILQMVREGDSFEHTGITIYVYAAYAFYKIITAIYSFIKERRNPSMIIMTTKSIKLADAFVSILALQTAMFREFAPPSEHLAVNMNIATGAVVCALTVAIGVYMIIRASLRIKKSKKGGLINSEQNEFGNDEQSADNLPSE